MKSWLTAAKARARVVRRRWQRPTIDGEVAHRAALRALAESRVIIEGHDGDLADADRTDDAMLPRVAVVMCLWNRPERIPKLLRAVAHSSGVRAEMYLWNNRAGSAGRIVADLQAFGDSLPRTTMADCAVNIGGFGRFYWARELASQYPFVVFIDDDQVLDRFALHDLVTDFEPRTLHSVWAFRFKNRSDYWSRRHVERGAQAKYVGTGGMIADSSIFTDAGLFDCPSKYWFMEDIWLSYYAQAVKGWKLYRSHAEIGMMLDDVGLTKLLRPAKAACFRELNKDLRWGDAATAEAPVPVPRGAPAVPTRDRAGQP